MNYFISEKVNNPYNYGYNRPNFKSVQENNAQLSTQPSTRINLETPPDSITLITKNQPKKAVSKKKKLSAGAKIGLGILAIAGTTILAIRFGKVAATKELSSLYDKKLKQSILPEEIVFKTAETKEEALKFTKETLGIKDVDKDITLEGLNFINKGIVDVSNANKGKVFLPSKIKWEDSADDFIAYVCQDVGSKDFAQLSINRRFFNESFLDKSLKEHFYFKDGKKMFELDDRGYPRVMLNGGFIPRMDNQTATLLKKYYDSAERLTIDEKRILLSIREEMDNRANVINRSPISFLKKNLSLFEEKGLTVPLEELSKKSKKEQTKFCKEIIKNLVNDKKTPLYFRVKYTTPIDTIYHEMGHLQDFGLNLKKLDLADLKNGSEKVVDRWGTVYTKDLEDLYNSKPAEFKEFYPDLYEFLTNNEIQETAGKISSYAQTGIGEFIAETYPKLIKKEKLPEDVIKLYEKYNGPKVS